MHFGKQIHIHLPDGTATGLKRAEISNWNGQAIAFPRSRLSELGSWSELKQPGVYFLIATAQRDAVGDRGTVYIGEAENVFTRLTTHAAKKDFWNEAIAFTSKDDRLTKAHVKFLEAKAIALSKEAGRYKSENQTSPTLPSLPRADCDSMDEFLYYVRLLLGTLGHNLLEELMPKSSRALDPGAGKATVAFSLKYKGLKTEGHMTDEGFVVLAGSQMSPEETESVGEGIQKQRERAIKEGAIKQGGTVWTLEKNMLFSSTSTAASFLAGASQNGRTAWSTQSGQTFKEWEELGRPNKS